MAQRGRKPKERKGYFYEVEENAINQYIHESNEAVKNQIFKDILYPALTTMIESIIRRYKLFVPNEEFDQNFNDTISYLLTKINHFRPIITSYDLIKSEEEIRKRSFQYMSESDYRKKARNAEPNDPVYIKVYFGDNGYDELKEENARYYKKVTHHYKAYSYCGTVCKNYLMFKSTQFNKKQKRNVSYDEAFEEINDNIKFSTIGYNTEDNLPETLVKQVSDEMDNMVNDPEEYGLNENEVIVGRALVDLLRNWPDMLEKTGSNKLQKSSILYFLREETMMTTKEVRDNMKPYKQLYYLLKSIALED